MWNIYYVNLITASQKEIDEPNGREISKILTAVIRQNESVPTRKILPTLLCNKTSTFF